MITRGLSKYNRALIRKFISQSFSLNNKSSSPSGCDNCNIQIDYTLDPAHMCVIESFDYSLSNYF